MNTVNGTAVAAPRVIMALVQQRQLDSGGVLRPECLRERVRDLGDPRPVFILRQLHKDKRITFSHVGSCNFFANKFREAQKKKKEYDKKGADQRGDKVGNY